MDYRRAEMTIVEILGLGLALLMMSIGLLGSVLPAIPSTPLVVLAAVAHRLWFGEQSASNLVLGLMMGLMLLSLLLDYLGSIIGARKLGATWRGVLGAVVGGLVGLFFSLPGIILGPFLGAGSFELMGGRPWSEATRAGLGAVLGLLFGAVGKIACCVAMMTLFTFSVVSRPSSVPAPAPVAPTAGATASLAAHLPGPVVERSALADVRDAGLTGDLEKTGERGLARFALHAGG
jgi:hypothetical protein